METVLLTGKVSVNSDEHLDRPITMRPDDRMTYYPQNDSLVQSVVEAPENSIVWRTGEIQFNDRAMHEIVEDLNVQYNANITIENNIIAKSRFTGSFGPDTSVEEILQTLSATKFFQFERSENGGWLIR